MTRQKLTDMNYSRWTMTNGQDGNRGARWNKEIARQYQRNVQIETDEQARWNRAIPIEVSRLAVPDESGSDESRLVPQLCGAAGTEDSLRVDLLALLSLIEGISNVAFQLIQVLEMPFSFYRNFNLLSFYYTVGSKNTWRATKVLRIQIRCFFEPWIRDPDSGSGMGGKS